MGDNIPKYVTVGDLMSVLSKLNPNANIEVCGEYYGCPLEQSDVRIDEEGNLVISYFSGAGKQIF